MCKLDVNAVFVPKHNPNLTFRTPKLMFALLSQLTHSSYRDVQSDLKNYNICDIGSNKNPVGYIKDSGMCRVENYTILTFKEWELSY